MLKRSSYNRISEVPRIYRMDSALTLDQRFVLRRKKGMVLQELREIDEDSTWDPEAEEMVRKTFPGLEAAN